MVKHNLCHVLGDLKMVKCNVIVMQITFHAVQQRKTCNQTKSYKIQYERSNSQHVTLC